jgi:mono/diheme cytochrome c family protein
MKSGRRYFFSDGKSFPSRNVILIPGIALAAGLFAYMGATIRSAHADDTAKPTRTTEEGVYTADQAGQGKNVYSQNCASCHMDDLSGSGQALPLTGDSFMQSWEGQTVDDLFEVIHDTMPQDKPGTLTPDATVQVIAYVLKYNQFPAGKTALPSDPAALKDILITTKKAASAPPAAPPAQEGSGN